MGLTPYSAPGGVIEVPWEVVGWAGEVFVVAFIVPHRCMPLLQPFLDC